MASHERPTRNLPAAWLVLLARRQPERAWYQPAPSVFRFLRFDTIIAEGVAKLTLYRHVPSKDDLIVAYLEESNRQFWEWLDSAASGVDDPCERLVAMFKAI